MNTVFTVDDQHEIEIRGDGTLCPKYSDDGPRAASQGQWLGHVGIQVNVARWDMGDSEKPVSMMKRLPHETVAYFTLTKSQARAVASMLLSAAQEARG